MRRVQTLSSSGPTDVSIVADDISDSLFAEAFESLAVAVDIETTGLAWDTDAIASVQVAVPDGHIEIVRVTRQGDRPNRLIELVQSREVLKVFHHAMFDLRFMRATWGVHSQRVACTKVASKVADPAGDVGHGLSDLVNHYLGVHLDKDEQQSNWQAAKLSSEQVTYAANDVKHLLPLLYSLLGELRRRDLESLALRCFEHLPTRVELEVRRLGDVYTY